MAPAAYLRAPEIVVVQRCRKVAWPSRQTAQQIARTANKTTARRAEITEQGVGVMNAYKCKVCGAWHVGHRRTQESEDERD
jgi:hypothetical protein